MPNVDYFLTSLRQKARILTFSAKGDQSGSTAEGSLCLPRHTKSGHEVSRTCFAIWKCNVQCSIPTHDLKGASPELPKADFHD